jgi:dipeptidyl aminopeptidase/acylaminoacyl peptidase
VLYVHTDEGDDCLALVDAEGRQWPRRLATGRDFYMWPRWSPDGEWIAYVGWDHPSMPWDGTLLHLLPVGREAAGPAPGEPILVAGGERVAIGQPEFSPDGRYLAYISDETGWNQLYLYDLVAGQARQVTTAEADHGRPAWSYDLCTYAWSRDGRTLVYRREERGVAHLRTLDVATGEERPVGGALADYTTVDGLVASPADDRIAFIGSTPVVPPRLVVGEPATGAARVLRRSAAEHVPAGELAPAEPVSWTAPDGGPVFGHYYPPTSARFTADGPAPLVVLVHGGPTSHAHAGYQGQVQFLATRGYGVLVVNYRGSTGHGKTYMDKLRGNWGICDVEDSVGGARWLVEQGRAHPEGLVIMGGSAGGFTVLQTMIDHPAVFKAGVCLFGVSDQFGLAAETHKFEARYTDSLLGPLPEAAAVYRARSPIFHADKIVRPLAVFQGEEDQVVPRRQSDTIVESLRRRNVPHEYHLYAGEGHGWRKRETIEAFYTALEGFLRCHVIYA